MNLQPETDFVACERTSMTMLAARSSFENCSLRDALHEIGASAEVTAAVRRWMRPHIDAMIDVQVGLFVRDRPDGSCEDGGVCEAFEEFIARELELMTLLAKAYAGAETLRSRRATWR